MKRFALIAAVGTVAAGFLLASPRAWSDSRSPTCLADPAEPVAEATIKNASGYKQEITGSVTFTQETDGVMVVADVDGLTPGKHGIHIHEKADLSAPDLKSAGGHFNPEHHKHGGSGSTERHAGDLGNIVADEKGHGHLEEHIKGLSVDKGETVVGHSVIIHAKGDDEKTDPAGDSGARIAGGAIVISKSGGKK